METKPLLTSEEFTRLANNFYVGRGLDNQLFRINIDAELMNYILTNVETVKKKFKVALCYICLNAPYWEYAKPMIEGSKKFFLPGHNVDHLFWTDMPHPDNKESFEKAEKHLLDLYISQGISGDLPALAKVAVERARESAKLTYEGTVFPTESVAWPLPTLMRYSLFLQQEEKLKDYDYIFYCDIDMLFVNVVGDEILGDGLTAAQHPMYALDKRMWMPFEPNEKSTAYVKRPGQLINDGGQPRFMPLYYAGGLQGGKSDIFIKAMKVMKKNIEQDFNKNYVAIWNDESHWNKYLSDNPPIVVLTPSYIYPDSLHKEYYIPRWGMDYVPKLVTLTKKHSLRKLTAEEQAQLTKMQ